MHYGLRQEDKKVKELVLDRILKILISELQLYKLSYLGLDNLGVKLYGREYLYMFFIANFPIYLLGLCIFHVFDGNHVPYFGNPIRKPARNLRSTVIASEV